MPNLLDEIRAAFEKPAQTAIVKASPATTSTSIPRRQVVPSPMLLPATVPQEWTGVPFAPGAPLTPWVNTGQRGQIAQEEPRTFDYNTSVNATIAPRIGYGLMSFAQLKYYAENVPEVSMLMRMATDEMKTLKPQIVGKDKKPVEIPELAWMTTYPDRYTAWPLWLSRFLYNVLAFDAPTLFKIPGEDGKTMGLRVIDGETIFTVIDERGVQPAPPAPAFVQIIHGTPYMWLTSSQLWYRPRQARADAPYGRTPVEDSLRAVQYLDNLWNYETASYTEGTMPDQMIIAPQDWTPDEALEWEREFNQRMAGNSGERRRIRLVPYGFAPLAIKQAPWNKEGYMTAFERVSYTFGFPMSEIGQVPGKNALGGKGYQDKGESQHERQGMGPLREFLESPFNDTLQELGYKDLVFKLALETEDIDTQRRTEQAIEDWINGVTSLDEVRVARGYTAVNGEDGKARLIPKGATLTTQAQQQMDMQQKQLDQKGQDQEDEGDDTGPNKPATNKPATGEPSQAQSAAPASQTAKKLSKFFPTFDLLKHCGVCDEDNVYYGAPVSMVTTIQFPVQGANETDIVAMSPKNHEPRPGLWKPASGENPELTAWIGGPMYPREEAAYLVDRMMDLYLVPVAYVAEVDGELGAVVHYVRDNRPPKDPAVEGEYAAAWIERAAVLDTVIGQVDRARHNWLTHPDDPLRPVLIDNGLSFPTTEQGIGSSFVNAWAGHPISAENLIALRYIQGKSSLWADIADLVGEDAANLARGRVAQMIQSEHIPAGQVA